jgi:hypothetical protein
MPTVGVCRYEVQQAMRHRRVLVRAGIKGLIHIHLGQLDAIALYFVVPSITVVRFHGIPVAEGVGAVGASNTCKGIAFERLD